MPLWLDGVGLSSRGLACMIGVAVACICRGVMSYMFSCTTCTALPAYHLPLDLADCLYLGGEKCEVYELNMHTSPLIAVRLKSGEGWLD